MIKFLPELTDVVLEEIPNRITLALEITNCQGNCPLCHSPFLRKDIGSELTLPMISRLIKDNFGVNCLLFLGEGNDRNALFNLAQGTKKLFPELSLAIYSGRNEVEEEVYELFDYVKTGEYIDSVGPLNNPNTNQRLYYHRKDITSQFWHELNSLNDSTK